MATVFDRIQNFEKSHWFRFNQKHKMFVGACIKRYWNQTDLSVLLLPLNTTESIEPEGTFKVFDYPEVFSSTIDSIISDYVLRMTTKKKKNNIGKPPISKPKLSKTKSSGPPPKRKRIPIQQPAYSTRKK